MQTLEKPSRAGSFWGPQSETRSEVGPKLGKEEVKAAATPSLPLGLGRPQPFPQNSIRQGSLRRGAALSAVLTPGPHRSSALRPSRCPPLLSSPQDRHFMVSPGPTGMDNGDGFP